MDDETLKTMKVISSMDPDEVEVLQDQTKKAEKKGAERGRNNADSWVNTMGRLRRLVVASAAAGAIVVVSMAVTQAVMRTDFDPMVEESVIQQQVAAAQEETTQAVNAAGDFEGFYKVKACPHCSAVHYYEREVNDKPTWDDVSGAVKNFVCQSCGEDLNGYDHTMGAKFSVPDPGCTGTRTEWTLKGGLTDAQWKEIGHDPKQEAETEREADPEAETDPDPETETDEQEAQ